MPIYNKDGSVYRIQGVNPLMKEQDHWSKEEKWEVHYPQTEEIVLTDPTRESLVVDEVSDVPTMVGVGVLPQTDILYCLPLVQSVDEDPLYGQQKVVTGWGDKFTFEAVQVGATGLTAVFFAKVPEEKVAPGSIIYVYKERQWWKVNGIEKLEEGINIHCMPSENKPSFV
jgi:hypothetical protein